MYVTATVFHSRVVYGFSNKDYGYCASARRPLDGTFKVDTELQHLQGDTHISADNYSHKAASITAKTPRVHGVTRTPALTGNTVLSRTGTGLRCDGAITDSAPTICAGFIAGSAQYHRVHGFQRIPARRPFYHRYPDRSSHGSLASTTTPSLAGPRVVIHNNYVLLLI